MLGAGKPLQIAATVVSSQAEREGTAGGADISFDKWLLTSQFYHNWEKNGVRTRKRQGTTLPSKPWETMATVFLWACLRFPVQAS